jgi:hypothetical protein
VVTGRLDERIRDRIVAETRGIPLALLELPRRTSAAELAGGFELPDLRVRLENHYASRVGELPESTQELMLVAAAEPLADAALVWRAVRWLQIDTDALTPARDAELLEIDARARFQHPLVHSAIYGTAPPARRQRVHQALADVSDAEAESRPACLAPCARHCGSRRGRRRRARAYRRPRTGSRRGGGDRGAAAARDGADAGPRAAP